MASVFCAIISPMRLFTSDQIAAKNGFVIDWITITIMQFHSDGSNLTMNFMGPGSLSEGRYEWKSYKMATTRLTPPSFFFFRFHYSHHSGATPIVRHFISSLCRMRAMVFFSPVRLKIDESLFITIECQWVCVCVVGCENHTILIACANIFCYRNHFQFNYCIPSIVPSILWPERNFHSLPPSTSLTLGFSFSLTAKHRLPHSRMYVQRTRLFSPKTTKKKRREKKKRIRKTWKTWPSVYGALVVRVVRKCSNRTDKICFVATSRPLRVPVYTRAFVFYPASFPTLW